MAPGTDVSLVFNPVDTDFFAPPGDEASTSFRAAHAEVFPGDSRPVFVFSGTFSNYIGLSTLMKALKEVKAATERFRFLMIGQGEGEQGMREFIAQNSLEDQVRILPFMERPELISYICAADYCFASLRDSPMLRYAIPTKIIEYLACNKEVVAVVAGPFGEMLKQADAATVCPPGDARAIAEVLRGIIERHPAPSASRQPRAFVEQNFSLGPFAREFSEFFRKLEPPVCGERGV